MVLSVLHWVVLRLTQHTRDTTDYMNLAYLLTGRDNLRQSMADMLGLRMAIGNSIDGALSSADFDTGNVQFVGQSLGSISGVGFTQLANSLPLGLTVQRSALSVPGGGIVPLLLDSPAFGDLVKDSVLAAVGLTQSDSAELVDPVLSQFAFAAQTVIDAADPLNFTRELAMLGTPLYVNEVVGGETASDLTDQVIPNQTSFSGLTFGGTEPLALFLGLDNVNSANSGAAQGIVRFDQGTHGSLLTGDAATAEMQAQVAAFLSGAGIVVGTQDTSVILGE